MKHTDYTGYDVEMMTKIKLIDAGPEGYVEWELPITSFYTNMNGVMHGGAAGVILGRMRWSRIWEALALLTIDKIWVQQLRCVQYRNLAIGSR